MSETKGHDLMCLAQEFGPVVSTRFCDCERVARIRADERAERGLANEPQGLALAEMLLHASRATEAKVLADLRAKVEKAILGEPCAEHGKAACVQTPTCRVEWAQKRLSRDIVRDLIGEVSE